MIKFFYNVMDFFSTRDKRVYFIFIVLLSILPILDLLGAALLGIIVLKLSGVENASTDRVFNFINLRFERFELITNNLFYFIILSAIILFLLKTLLANYLNYRMAKFLAVRDSLISKNEFENYFLSRSPSLIHQTLQEISTGLTSGITGSIVRFLMSFQVYCVEFSLLILFTLALIFLQNLSFFIIVIIFGALTLLISKILSNQTENTLSTASVNMVQSQQAIQDIYFVHREVLLTGSIDVFSKRFSANKRQFSMLKAQNVWLSQLPRYIYEILLLLSIFVAAIISSNMASSSEAIAEVGIALISISRVVPSLLRLVTAYLGMRSAMGESRPWLQLRQATASARSLIPGEVRASSPMEAYLGISITRLSFKHQLNVDFEFQDFSLVLPFGKSLAIVGPSGGGKSTLVDLLLGFLNPQSGHILIDGLDPLSFVRENPNAIRLVPQKPYLIKGSVLENLVIFSNQETDVEVINRALSLAEFLPLLHSFPEGLNRTLGMDGQGLSGGEKQRLAIARAMIDRPRYLILDEATNALQDDLEEKLVRNLLDLPWDCTVVLITHNERLADLFDIKIRIGKG
jgi:ABC-type multidrug transport system fused ATPase/permease subunit